MTVTGPGEGAVAVSHLQIRTTAHAEATPHLHYALAAVRDAGCTAGAAICPATPAGALAEVAQETLDLALCMSVNPGWSAQEFIPASLQKLRRMRDALPEHVALEAQSNQPRTLGDHRTTRGEEIRNGDAQRLREEREDDHRFLRSMRRTCRSLTPASAAACFCVISFFLAFFSATSRSRSFCVIRSWSVSNSPACPCQ